MDFKPIALAILLPTLCLAASKDKFYLVVDQPAPDQFGHVQPVKMVLRYDSESKALADTGRIDKVVGQDKKYSIDEVIIDKNGKRTDKKIKAQSLEAREK